MQPKLQQLDLFGGPAQEIGGVKEKKKSKAKPEPALVQETPAPAASPAPVAISSPAPVLEKPVLTETVLAQPELAETFIDESIETIYVERPRQPRVSIEKIAGKRGRKSYSEIDTEIDLIEIPSINASIDSCQNKAKETKTSI